jgi:hypothetical protein
MADNTTLPIGTGGDLISTDELSTRDGAAATAGEKVQLSKPGFGAPNDFRSTSRQFPFPVDTDSRRLISYRGRAGTFRIPGRGGTAGQKLFSIHNATGSTTIVDVEKITLDMACTVVKAVTVLPPMVRLYRVTVLPTNGTAVTKVARDTTQSSSASVTILQDASADGTSSGTALTATLPAGNFVGGEFAPRLITAAGYEMSDRIEFLEETDEVITLRPLEGLVAMLDYPLATQNPVTDMWVVKCKWTEYTTPN